MSQTKTKTEKEAAPQALSEKEQQVLILEEIQRFIKLAKERGTLAIEEINELLPHEMTAPTVLDQFMQALEVNGVIITDGSEAKKEDEEERLFNSDEYSENEDEAD